MSCEPFHPSRRAVLGLGGTLTAWAFMPRTASAAGARDPRFVTIVLRGAMDGLSAVAPVADPDYMALREGIALTKDGENAGIPLDGFFVLHPSMPVFARLWQAKQALVVHATATHYRDRSHFDGQDVLESGQPGPGRLDTGWLNRAIALLPAGDRIALRGGLGIGSIAPLVIRGEAPVLGWAPQSLPKAEDSTAGRILDLYRHTDPALAAALSRGLATDKMASRSGLSGDAARPRGGADSVEGMKHIASGAARLIAQDDGPRVAALAFEGWDTHVNSGGAKGRLATLLSGLDAAIGVFETTLGEAWKQTTILVVTEFGRTARVNGSVGTDHGTATVAFLVGGGIAGGRIIADWPGLSAPSLHEGRDLKPTTDLRGVIKGVLADQLGLSPKMLGETVFPDSGGVQPVKGLVAGG